MSPLRHWKAPVLALSLAASGPLQAETLSLVPESQETNGSSELQVGDALPGHYIVRLDPEIGQVLNVPDLAAAVETLLVGVGGGEASHIYDHAMTGAAVRISATQAGILRSMPGVEAVERDRVVKASATTQPSPTWGLDRVDQRNLPNDDAYRYAAPAGEGVNVYVIDTGLRASHEEFDGRVEQGRNFAANDSGLLGLGGLPLVGPILNLGGESEPEDTADCNGHGTHVASTAAGTTYGVAKEAQVVPVRVLDCSGGGSTSDVIAGVDWVTANHEKPAVANMSLGGGDSESLDEAVENAIEAGVTFVVAAGNSDADACGGSPNRVADAVTVGSTTREDERSSFSNFGTCVDLFAPGSDITGAWYESDTQTNTISGTSMASPHVAGSAALLLDDRPELAPAEVAELLEERATSNVLSNLGSGSPNLLLYTLESSTQ